MKKLLLLFSLLLFLIPTTSMAVVNAGIHIDDEPLKPDDVYSVPAMQIFNTGDEAANFTMKVVDSDRIESSRLQPSAIWLTFDQQIFWLEPGESQIINSTLTIPSTNVESGEYVIILEAGEVVEEEIVRKEVITKVYFTVVAEQVEVVVPEPTLYSGPSYPAEARLRGKILLQVEENGEAWYVKPEDGSRIYMEDGDAAYGMMRDLGLGITNADIAKIPIGFEDRFECVDSDSDGLCDKLEDGLGTDKNNSDSDGDGYDDGTEIKSGYDPLTTGKLSYDSNLVNKLKGKILLQVETNGEAWYVSPDDGKRYYMPDGPAAYQIMRFLSLGISNNDLAKIDVETVNLDEAVAVLEDEVGAFLDDLSSFGVEDGDRKLYCETYRGKWEEPVGEEAFCVCPGDVTLAKNQVGIYGCATEVRHNTEEGTITYVYSDDNNETIDDQNKEDDISNDGMTTTEDISEEDGEQISIDNIKLIELELSNAVVLRPEGWVEELDASTDGISSTAFQSPLDQEDYIVIYDFDNTATEEDHQEHLGDPSAYILEAVEFWVGEDYEVLEKETEYEAYISSSGNDAIFLSIPKEGDLKEYAYLIFAVTESDADYSNIVREMASSFSYGK